MSESRIVVVQYCDDVRQETGNKYSLMGCYGSELIIDKIPAVLPKLCAQIRAITPVDRPFSRLTLRALINDDIIAEIDVPTSEISSLPIPSDTTRLTGLAIMTFAPLAITESCRLRIVAETEDDTLYGNALKIRERLPSDPMA